MPVSATDLPEELQLAMRARDQAFYDVDADQWGKYTAPDFTTVQQGGALFSRVERIANLQAQSRRTYVPRSREHYELHGDLAVARFLSGGLWVVEVWKRHADSWKVVLSQATTASP